MQESLKVESVMKGKGKVHKIKLEATVAEAARIMRDCKVGCLVVVHANDRIAGIISERDIVEKVVALAGKPEAVRVSDVMTPKVIAISPDATLSRAQKIMADYRIRHLPVMLDGKADGMVSSRDIMAWELHSANETIRRQNGILRDIEAKYPGITKMQTDVMGRIVI